MRNFLQYTVLLVILAGCKKDQYETEFKSVDRNYFNQQISSYSVYEVYEILFDDFTNTSDTFNYQIKEVNESSFKDNLGRESIRIERFKRNTDTSNWEYLNTWYSVVDSRMVERVEDNKRLLKLSYPITVDAVWNSNELNMDNVNNVFYGLMHQSYKLDAVKYDSVVSVESSPISNSFRDRSFKEVYAKDIGLIYKYIVYIDKLGLLLRGSKVRYKLIQHVR